MPFCPQCGDEFREGIAVCPDCEVTLQASPPQGEKDAMEPYFFEVAEPRLRDWMAKCLDDLNLPYEKTETGLAVPNGLRESIEPVFARWLEVEEINDDSVRVIGSRQAVPEGAMDLLQRPASELAAESEQTVPRLREITDCDDKSTGREAAIRLLRVYELNGSDLREMLMDAVGRGARREAYALTEAIAEEEKPGELPLRVAGALPSLNEDSLSLGLHALSRIPERRVAPLVVPFLEHDSETIRAEADDVLCCISGDDVGFDAAAVASDRAKAVSRWKQWVERNVSR